MQLSNRANKYLEKLERNINYTCTQDLIESYLLKNKLTAFKSVIDYQINISGYTFPVGENPSKSFNASLFSVNDIKEGKSVETIQINKKSFFFCGDFISAQFNIVLSEDGEICTFNEGNVNPIYISGELLIENFALMDYLSKNAIELPPYYELNDNEELKQEVAGHGSFSRANDRYNTWYMTDNIVVHKGTWFDRPEFYIHIYGKTLEETKDFQNLLLKKEIIR